MWIGFRKGLGKGFSIGVGKRITGSRKSSSRQTHRRPTQAELAKAEKIEFLMKVAEDANAHYNGFLKDGGVDVKALEAEGKTVDGHFEKVGRGSEYQEVKKTMLEIKELAEKIEYGASLTARRREQLIDLVFTLRKLSPTRAGELAGDTSHGNPIRSPLFKRRLTVFVVIWALLLGIMFLDAEYEMSIGSIFSFGVIAVVFWLPYYAVSKGLELYRERQARKVQ